MKKYDVSDNVVRLLVVLFAIFTIYVLGKMGHEQPPENRDACIRLHEESTHSEGSEQNLS